MSCQCMFVEMLAYLIIISIMNYFLRQFIQLRFNAKNIENVTRLGGI
jgi:flagellar biogenesis protein FliO